MTKMEVETLRGRNRKAAARYRAKNKEKMTKITINLHSLKETHNCLKQEAEPSSTEYMHFRRERLCVNEKSSEVGRGIINKLKQHYERKYYASFSSSCQNFLSGLTYREHVRTFSKEQIGAKV
ncbi:hypothetical protein GLOIN_2v1482523 [Rhizophagus irregularis DAOM 181602=DAOM 197198]|uniref:BZIP domain-containing protein n=1 Tax=Rhizophagus irregularis (strain DAOM 181602 / DAOM 197198 / MUCL 43194) TaxID=747089 RepID=A0A2P4PLI4_RHIID|nr:hypothetical protein GLOIN_2v1482523 [Rhizophagus irregularis DAOM 181602=DAOM 197198]POG66235.1 hypothetical protein GLOIN_2v1482523 [Rhizophagus irregularis DAOM 181602=DAOM 197198]|eukprot:XP_025173101.1 hypothetical protein GLOIN_2v1482523 [Rhizophagus irregularis DAOM 181602=DAOM 197198]